MDSTKVKSILRLYRPGLDEKTDSISEALAQTESDPDLRTWYKRHRQNEDAISEQFNDIAIPIDIKEQLKQQFVQKTVTPKRQPWLAPLAIAASLILAVLSWVILSPENKQGFNQFQQDMIAFATQPYEMDIVVEDLTLISKEFAKVGWPTNYTPPEPLNALHALGGVTQKWNNKKVSIVCLEDEAGKYIWLYITKLNTFNDHRFVSIDAEIVNDKPLLTHAAWQDKQFHYYMIAEGDVGFINRYL